MFSLFTKLADHVTHWLGLNVQTHLGSAVYFFVEDITKIFVLLYLLIFIISLFRAQLSPEKVREYLSGKNRWYGYFLAVFLGIVTPFCSCSSIPLFIGFITAGIPFGITMAFLISSPLVSEIATFMLIGMNGAGVAVAGLYVVCGSLIAVLGGYLADRFNLVRLCTYQPAEPAAGPACCCNARKSKKQRAQELIAYAHFFAWDTIKNLWLYIVLGLLVGAAIHGYVPMEFLSKYLGPQNPWAVPLASVIGAPMYANHVGVIPVIQALLLKGVPIGTALVILMSITAISLPEMMMLKKVLSAKMIGLFILYLILSFICVGYILNWVL